MFTSKRKLLSGDKSHHHQLERHHKAPRQDKSANRESGENICIIEENICIIEKNICIIEENICIIEENLKLWRKSVGTQIRDEMGTLYVHSWKEIQISVTVKVEHGFTKLANIEAIVVWSPQLGMQNMICKNRIETRL